MRGVLLKLLGESLRRRCGTHFENVETPKIALERKSIHGY
jgi:hypothetical protein